MSSAPRFIPRYTASDYQTWQGDWELWDGIPIAMTPSPFGSHQRIAARLLFEIQLELRRGRCGAEAIFETDWIVSDTTVVRPDIVLICGRAPEKFITAPPEVVVEIFSASTRDLDRGYKRELYQREKVPVYLMVDPDARCIDVDRRIGGEETETFTVGKTLELRVCDDCELRIEIDALFC